MKRYRDRYLRDAEEALQGKSEQERQLQLFISWLNVRKKLQLPDMPEKLVKEFLALDKYEDNKGESNE